MVGNVINGLGFLEKNNLAHGNLNLSNIYLNPDSSEIKITSYGSLN